MAPIHGGHVPGHRRTGRIQVGCARGGAVRGAIHLLNSLGLVRGDSGEEGGAGISGQTRDGCKRMWTCVCVWICSTAVTFVNRMRVCAKQRYTISRLPPSKQRYTISRLPPSLPPFLPSFLPPSLPLSFSLSLSHTHSLSSDCPFPAFPGFEKLAVPLGEQKHLCLVDGIGPAARVRKSLQG